MRALVPADGGGSCGAAAGGCADEVASPPRARSPKTPSASTKADAAPMARRVRMVLPLARIGRGRAVGRLAALELRVEAAVRCRDVGERGAERHVVDVDAVAQGQLVALQEAADDAERA